MKIPDYMTKVRTSLETVVREKGIAKTTLSLKIGKSKTLVSEILTKNEDIKLSTLARLADELEVPIERLIGVDVSPQPPREISEEGLGRLLHALAPSFPDSDASELGAQALAGALKYALELLRETDANEPTDREISMAARAAISRYRAGDAA